MTGRSHIGAATGLKIIPCSLSEASTQSFEISEGVDMIMGSLLKGKEEEIHFQKSLKN